MITKIQTKDFKGRADIEQTLGKLNLVIGPNGSGKSARTDALQLLINGHIMGVGKRNSDIFEACAAPGQSKIFVGCTSETDGRQTKFLKRYAKDAAGAVGLVYHVRDTKATAASYAAAMGAAGNYTIVDPSAFMDLSGPKQIEEIFSLFHPDGDLSALNSKAADIKERINKKQKDKVGLEQLVATLTQSISRLDLGTGTLADVEVEKVATLAALDATKAELANERARITAEALIEQNKSDHAGAMAALNKQAAVDIAAAQTATDESDERYQALIRRTNEVNAQNAARDAGTIQSPEVMSAVERLRQNAKRVGGLPALEAAISGADNPLMKQHVDKMDEIKQSGAAITAIEKIIGVMNRAGCTECTALLVARKELRAIKGGAT